MSKEESRLDMQQKQVQEMLCKVNNKIEELGSNTSSIFNKLNEIAILFERIRNVPLEEKIKYEKTKKVRCNWKQQADKIEENFKNVVVKDVGMGAAGASAGAAVALMGPTAAMGVATTFGVASTGTAIASLSGAAATNAALAWLGGGALAVGGGGMAAGNAFLALAGPVGWILAGVAVLGSGTLFFKAKNDKKKVEEIFILVGERDVRNYNLSLVELNERIDKINNECGLLDIAIRSIESMDTDYTLLSQAEKYELGSYVNLMLSSTQLLTEPILGLQPKYTEKDYNKYMGYIYQSPNLDFNRRHKDVIISLCNTFYKINMNDSERKLLYKTLKGNKDFLKSIGYEKKDFDKKIFDEVASALEYCYHSKEM